MSIAPEISRQNPCAVRGQSTASIWHKSVPKAVQKAYEVDHDSAGWKAWQRHLRARKRPVGLVGGDQAITWVLNPVETASLLPQLSQDDHLATINALHDWLRDSAGGRFKLDYALSAVTWCRCLPQLAAVLPASAWWKLLDHLLQTVAEAGEDCACSEDEPLVRQLLAGELPLTLAYLLPEIAACRELRSNACLVLSGGLADLLDGEGLPHARLFDRLPSLLACWTRCRELGSRLKRNCWSAEAERQYRQLVRNALRLTRCDGSLVFSASSTDGGNADLLAAAMALVGDEDDHALAAAVLPGSKEKRRQGKAGSRKATIHSEWAAAALLRPDWSRSAPRLTVLYPDTDCRIELACGRDVLCSGQWSLEVSLDGVLAAPKSEWVELCWISDEDVDYLELEINLGDDVRVQRHMLLARKDRFLLLADTVLAPRRATIQYRGTLPRCPGVAFQEACETREAVLVGRKPRAKILPLALPEWLADRRNGSLSSTGAGIELRQRAVGQALFAPLFLDLDRRRMSKPLTWRQLTVAESWAVQPADVAVGYRVAIGKRHWLFYRSLNRPQNRTLLGHNLSSEMLAARFLPDGEVESLIEIE
jgi:hypothetical protein